MIFLIKFCLCAIIAIVINIVMQIISLELYNGEFSLFIAMSFGTLGGLIAKYFLDKNFIFGQQTSNISEDGVQFFIYSMLGVITTAIFWGVEISFDYLFDSPMAKYVGAVTGLSIGYTLKYFLDRRYVFVSREGVS